MTTSSRLTKALMSDFLLDNWHGHRVNRDTFTVYIGGDPQLEDYEATGQEPGVEHRMADRLEMNLHLLANIDPKKPVLIIAATCGGNYDEGMQMFGSILAAPNPITILSLKWARSMSSLFPLAADRFLIRPPTTYMFHYGTMYYEGNAGEEFKTTAEELEFSRKMMLDLYVERLKSQGKFVRRHRAAIRDMLEDKMRRKVDVWLTADEAVEWGFADEVFLGGEVKRATKKDIARRNGNMAVLRGPRKI